MNVYGKRGLLIRVLYLMAAMLWYVLTLGGRLNCGNTVVLCYHGICSDHRERFQWQMSRISGRAVEMGKLTQVKPSCNMTSPKICITFDDAFVNLLDNVLPILEEFQIPATIFAVTGNLGDTPKWAISANHPEAGEKTMTSEQLVMLSKNPLIRIGSHTQTHPDLSKLSPDQVLWELTESKKNLGKLLGKPVEDLALPHGAYNEKVLHIAQEVGYKRIYTLEPNLVKENQEMGVIGRFSTSPDVWPIEFYLTCCGAYSWLRLFRRSVRFFRNLGAYCRTSK
jgi:peptidoglycan/xylan/chitin deacetylase (PgdA/CDA1 family)